MKAHIAPNVLEAANRWLTPSFDKQTQSQVQNLIDNDVNELQECFYRTLEFGTGGLRGIMGVGTNRMNIYTVAMATQGLANYVKACNLGVELKAAIAYDCRNNSELFAAKIAEVLSANGFTVYLFDALRPTPELSFAIRQLKCHTGVMVTASHNPKEYNGYKAYWSDGSQVIAPHDTNIIDEVNKITDPSMVLTQNVGDIHIIGKLIDEPYLNMIKELSLSPDAVESNRDMKIVYTPIHGTGVKMVPDALRSFGFTNIIPVPEQDVIDGNFPTVVSPNPEESEAMKMAVQKALETGADIVMATDPDADRQAIAIRNDNGEFVLLNGNQSAVLLTYYLCRRWKELGKVTGNEFVVRTVVTTKLIEDIANSFGIQCFEVLTGFKFIAKIILENEGKLKFIGGGEESFGYLVGDEVRDKDAVASLCVLAECAAWAKQQGKTMWTLLMEIYTHYGLYLEDMISITKPGKEGVEQIAKMMSDVRANHPKTVAGETVTEIFDYQSLEKYVEGKVEKINQPKSNVLQFATDKGTVVSMRPSGTEPKIKFYFSLNAPMSSTENFDSVKDEILAKINEMKKELGLV